MARIYLYVTPEEYAEAEAAGACWDDASKRWYLPDDGASAALTRWLGDDGDYGITSDEAQVACARVPCSTCRENIEVICIYCRSGMDCESGELMTRFTVSHIWAMNGALAAQLERWQCFRLGSGAGVEAGYFANHCPHCGAMQEDYLLHSEPGDIFFCIPRAESGSIEFMALSGRIQVSGDCSFGSK